MKTLYRVRKFGHPGLALALVAAMGPARGDDRGRARPAPTTPAALAEIRSASLSRIGSLRVVYGEILETPSVPGEGATILDQATYLTDYAFKGEKVRQRIQTIADERGYVRHKPPYTFLNAGTYTKWWPSSRVRTWRSTAGEFADGTMITRSDHYMEAIGYWPYRTPDLPIQGFYQPQALRSHAYAASASREEVEGVPCVVLERPAGGGLGLDRIWIDPEAGGSIRRRVWEVPARPDQLGRQIVYAPTDFREVTSGVWLPYRVRVTHRLIIDPAAKQHLPTTNAEIIVDSIEVNSLDDRWFEPPEEPGTLIRRAGSPSPTIVPGGEEILDTLLNDVEHGLAEHEPKFERPQGLGGPAAAFAGALAIFLGIKAAGRFARRTARRPRPAPTSA